jgi:hypothetical protein
MLWAFDLLQLNREDLRQLPLDQRKAKLAELLRTSRHSGMIPNEHLESVHSCMLGFEGIVSRQPIHVRPQQHAGQDQEPTCDWCPAVSGRGGDPAHAIARASALGRLFFFLFLEFLVRVGFLVTENHMPFSARGDLRQFVN